MNRQDIVIKTSTAHIFVNICLVIVESLILAHHLGWI